MQIGRGLKRRSHTAANSNWSETSVESKQLRSTATADRTHLRRPSSLSPPGRLAISSLVNWETTNSHNKCFRINTPDILIDQVTWSETFQKNISVGTNPHENLTTSKLEVHLSVQSLPLSHPGPINIQLRIHTTSKSCLSTFTGSIDESHFKQSVTYHLQMLFVPGTNHFGMHLLHIRQ